MAGSGTGQVNDREDGMAPPPLAPLKQRNDLPWNRVLLLILCHNWMWGEKR